MKRKVKALLALALTLALVSTTLGDNWLYVSAENAAEAKEQSDEPTAAAEEETDEPAAAPEEAAPEETAPVEEAAAAEEETAPVEPVPEEKQTEEQKLEAAEAPAEQPTEAPSMADEQKQPTENPAPADEQKQPAETPAEQPTEAPAADTAAPAAPAEVPAADAEVKEAEKAPEAEVPGADEKDTETVEEEIGLIEQTIEAFVDTEEKDVVITLTGEMPEGATASACPVDISMDGVNIISAYDITIYDADGQEFQPSDEKPLQVKIEDEAVRKALEENTELEVYHLEDAEAEPEQVQEVNLEAAAVEFQAPSFSIYAVVTPEQHFTHTYQFMDEDGTTLLSEQILSAGEVLNEPESPAKAHKKFIGWFDEKDNLFNSFDEEGTLSASITTVLKAKYETVYYVFYKAGNSTDSKILYTQTYHNASDPIVADGVPFAVPSEKALIGWSVNPEAETPDKDLMLKGEDVTLYPVVADAHWITYDTQSRPMSRSACSTPSSLAKVIQAENFTPCSMARTMRSLTAGSAAARRAVSPQRITVTFSHQPRTRLFTAYISTILSKTTGSALVHRICRCCPSISIPLSLCHSPRHSSGLMPCSPESAPSNRASSRALSPGSPPFKGR